MQVVIRWNPPLLPTFLEIDRIQSFSLYLKYLILIKYISLFQFK